MATYGRQTRKEKWVLVKKAEPDDPIFTRGFIVGGHYPKRKPKLETEKGCKPTTTRP